METRADRYAGAAVLLVSFAVYLLTLAPEVTFWDSGELIYGAITLGIPHPPAYPSFCMLGKAFYLMPFGNAAYRVNLMSAFFASLTAYMLYRLVREMAGYGPSSTPVAVAAALTYAFFGPAWSQSVVAEVYALNSLILSLIAYSLFRYDREGRESWLHLSAFLLGLAFAGHQSALFLLPVYVLYYLFAGRVAKHPERPLLSAFFAFLGYSVIIYLPVRASAGPAINIGDPQVLWWFKWVLKLSEHTQAFSSIPARLTLIAGGHAALALAAAAAVCTVLVWILRKRPFLLFLVFASASYLAGIRLLTAGSEDVFRWGLQKKFYMPVAMFAVPVAAQLAGALMGLAKQGKNKDARGRAAVYMAAWALLALPAAEAVNNRYDNDNSRNFFAFDFASNTMKSVMQDGTLFAWGDNGVFPVWYLQGHERYREDILFIHTELMTHPWYMEGVLDSIRRKYGVQVASPSDLTRFRGYVPVLKLVLEKRTPTYFDYSAAGKLGIDYTRLRPQGLIHLSKSWRGVPLAAVWDRYVLRGAMDDSSNKGFAAEGILGIYAYECGIWAQSAYERGRNDEALKAYEMMKKLGGGNRFMDIWADRLKREMGVSEIN